MRERAPWGAGRNGQERQLLFPEGAMFASPGVGDKRAGTAGGLFFSAAEIGGVGGPVLLGILFHAQGRFSSSLMVLALLGVLLVASVFPLRRHLLSKA